MYNRFSESYSQPDKYNLIRVDSTIVSEAALKIKEGIDHKNGKKLMKYGVSFDRILPAGVEVFNAQSYASEEFALPEAILKQVVKDTEHSNIYITDRGVQSTCTIKDFSDKKVKFVIRAKDNRKHEEIKSLIETNQDLDLGDNLLIKDSIVKPYTGIPVKTRKKMYIIGKKKLKNILD